LFSYILFINGLAFLVLPLQAGYFSKMIRQLADHFLMLGPGPEDLQSLVLRSNP